MRKKQLIYCLLVIGIILFSIQSVYANPPKSPNVIYIYASDLGKGLLSAYGQKHFTTPHIDALINNGVSFHNAYGGSISAYARASQLTGYHDSNRNKWLIKRGGSYMASDTVYILQSEEFIDLNPVFLPDNDLYLPQVFRNAGYVTAQIGKLGIGNVSTRSQMQRYGWDYYYGYLDLTRSQGYYPPFLFENGQMILIEGNTRADAGKSFEMEAEIAYQDRWNREGKKTYSPDLFINKVIECLQEFKEQPFFLMYSANLPHGPVAVPAIHPEVENNGALTQIEKEYASMVKLLDDQVGIIMSELKALNLEENTMVVFSSDNGHDIFYLQQNRLEKPFHDMVTGDFLDNSYYKYYSKKAGDIFNGNAGLAGLKYSNLEGGIQVPLAFYWKGMLKSRISGEIVAGYDLLSTMADLLGQKLPAKKDGVSLLPIIAKGKKLPKNRQIIVGSEEGPAIITNERWKLRYYGRLKKYELYNLKNDAEEKYDISLRFPQKTEELKKLLLDACDGKIENGVFY